MCSLCSEALVMASASDLQIFLFQEWLRSPPMLLKSRSHSPEARGDDSRETWYSRSASRSTATATPWSFLCQSSIACSSLMIAHRSEEHTSELQSLMRISYAVFCLQKKIITHLN